MKKLLGILVMVLLFNTNVFAKTYESLHNISFEIPENFVFINKNTVDELILSADNQKLKDLYLYMKQTLQTNPIELIFNLDLVNQGMYDNIAISSSESNLVNLKDVANNEKAICEVKLLSLKRLNGEDKIKSHKCVLINYPKNVEWSVQEFHQNLNNKMQNVHSITFKISKNSKKITSILITCGQNCNTYLPALNKIVNTANLKIN